MGHTLGDPTNKGSNGIQRNADFTNYYPHT